MGSALGTDGFQSCAVSHLLVTSYQCHSANRQCRLDQNTSSIKPAHLGHVHDAECGQGSISASTFLWMTTSNSCTSSMVSGMEVIWCAASVADFLAVFSSLSTKAQGGMMYASRPASRSSTPVRCLLLYMLINCTQISLFKIEIRTTHILHFTVFSQSTVVNMIGTARVTHLHNEHCNVISPHTFMTCTLM